MGLIGSFLRGVGRAIGKGVEFVGDLTGIDGLSRAGRSIQEFCAERVAEEKSYDKNEDSIHMTDRLNEILVAFSDGYYRDADRIEKNCIKLLEKYYDELINIIEDGSHQAFNTANLKALKAGKKRIPKMVMGSIKNPLAKRMSLDDSECLSILKMDSGAEKKRAMTRFTNKVINEALSNLSQNVKAVLNEQCDDIQEYLTDVLEEQEKSILTQKELYEKMSKDDELEQSEKEKNCVIPLFLIKVSDHVSLLALDEAVN